MTACPETPQGSPARPATANAASARPAPGCGPGGSKAEDDAVAVRVAVHIRPLVESELAKGCQEILEVTPGQAQVTVGQHTFTYDNVYGSCGDGAAGLYPDCVAPLVEGLFKGYNATVFAYGQTGSGKTYTMGSAWSPEADNSGVIPQVMDELFSRVERDAGTEFTVKVSFVEIHKEEVRDLLWTSSAVPRPVVSIRELPSGVSLSGASERLVGSREEMSDVLMQGTLMRAVAATDMNNRSSRSHAIFTITLEQRRRQLVRPVSAPPAVDCTPGGSARRAGSGGDSGGDSSDDDEEDGEAEEEEAGDEYLIAKMHLVDLAGSERAKRTGAQGMRLCEAININKGLLALAKVITALVDGQSHVPYRDSKLTRLLQDSLGGNSRTVMIACVSPADINREESLNTLRYADRARRIKNKPVVNRDPVAAQLAALRQQIAGLRAENVALRTALGGDAAAATALAAASAGQGVASEALQEAYDDLAVRCNRLEVDNAKQQMELESAHSEARLLRSGLLAAETQRDQLLLRLQALQAAAAASSDASLQAALAADAAAAAALDGAAAATPAAEGASWLTQLAQQSSAPASPPAAQEDPSAAAEAAAAAGAVPAADAPPSLAAEMGVVAGLRARVSELEAELRQVRSLQRMTSNALARGISSVSLGGAMSGRGRAGSITCASAAALRSVPTRLGMLSSGGGATRHYGSESGAVHALDGPDADELEVPLSPVTPVRPGGAMGADLLSEPLLEAAPDAEVLAQSAAHVMAREAMALKLEVLGRQMEAKQKRLLALQSAADMQGAKGKYMAELQKERDTLAKEKTALLQKLAAVTQAGAEERKRLEQSYRDKLTAVERRLKELADREKASKRSAAQLGRVQAVCQQLQADITRMKHARASVQRRMEAKEREFREWRVMREREVLQLRRNAQRQNAALQQHQAMHSKQQAVLKRKTEEAEAARRKLRDLMELQARVRRDKASASGGTGAGPAGSGADAGVPSDLELQPNAAAPLLRTEKARREWVEQELELCSTSWQYQKVLDGELAQRAEATRKLREVQKRLMLLGGLVPPSPVVTAAAVAAHRGSSSGGGLQPEDEVLQAEARALQSGIDEHTRNVKELQEQWERARTDEQSRGTGAADVRRWTGIRNIVEARELLRTLFICACSQRAQVCESQMELAKLQEASDILEIRLDMALQQAAEAKRKALEAEATAVTVISTPAHQLAIAAAAAASSDDDGEDGGGGGGADGKPGDGGSDGGTPCAPRLVLQHRLCSTPGSAGRGADGAAELVLGGLGGPAGGPEVRDDTDIEADNLLHSMGLPPIAELPGSSGGAEPAAAAGAEAGGEAGGGEGQLSGLTAALRAKLAARSARYWRAAPSGSGSRPAGELAPAGDAAACAEGGRTSALLRAAAAAWQAAAPGSGDGARAGCSSGTRPSSASGARRSTGPGAAAVAAQDLAAKLDALEVDWQGYKRHAAAAAAAGGSSRRSLSGSGQLRRTRASCCSLPSSPRGARAPGPFSQGRPGSALGVPSSGDGWGPQPGRDAARRASLSACSSPVGGPLAPAGHGGSGAGAFWPHQQLPGGLPGGCSSPTGAAAAAPGGRSRADGVAKSLNFDAEEQREAWPHAAPHGGGSPERPRWAVRPSHARPGSASGSAGSRRRGAAASAGPQVADAAQDADDEVLQGLADPAGEAEPEPGAGGAGRFGRPSGSRAQDDSDDAFFEEADADEEAGEGDSEDSDPSYDPVLHKTPARGPRARQRAGRGAKPRGSSHASRLSAASSEADTPPGADSSSGSASGQRRAAARSSAPQPTGRAAAAAGQQPPPQPPAAQPPLPAQPGPAAAGASASASGGVASASSRILAAQVTFNHEKRRGWERPVLEDINARRTAQGLGAVDKLTIQLLKEAMAGQELDGRPWVPGNKTKDSLIADYRRMLQLHEADDEATDINRVTGAANWPMPCGSPELGRGGSWAAAGGARRVVSTSLPVSPGAHEAHGVRAMMGSPLRALASASARSLGSASGCRASSPPVALAPAAGSGRGVPELLMRSVDGSLMGGAAREPAAQPLAGALQQRALRSSSSGSSSKLRVVIPTSASRADGPWSARAPTLSGGGAAQEASAARSSSRHNQPTWR